MSGDVPTPPALTDDSPVPTPVSTAGSTPPAGRAPPSRHPLQPVFEAGTVRARSAQVLQSVERGLSAHFVVKRDSLATLAERLAEQLTEQANKTPRIESAPSAWQAFPWPQLQAGGLDRLAELDTLLADKTAQDQTRARLDLALVCVLLGTDISPQWRCTEQHTLPTAAFVHAPADDLLALLDSAAPPRASPAAPAAPAQTAAAGPPVLTQTLDDAAAGNTTAQAPATPPALVVPVAPVVPAAAAAVATAPPASAPTPSPLAGDEGVAVAVFRAFVAGAFSAHRHDPCRVDTSALRHVDVSALRAVLQGSTTNPVPGLEGRAQLLAKLGAVLQEPVQSPARVGTAPSSSSGRVCDLLDGLPEGLRIQDAEQPNTVSAESLLAALLRRLAPAWQAGSTVQGLPAGDVWPHLWAGEACAVQAADDGPVPQDRGTGGWVPLHAQGLKLVAALEGPLQQMGCTVRAVHTLPVAACRSTSALMLRAQVLVPRHTSLLQRSLKPGHDAVVENRALTVALFEELAVLVQQRLAAAGFAAHAAPTAAGLVQPTADLLHSKPALQLKIEGDGALF